MPKVQKTSRGTGQALATTTVFGSKKPKNLCQEPVCGTRASFGPANGTAVWCRTHCLPDHVDLVSKKCKAPGCFKQPNFGLVDGAAGDAQWCSDHRLPNYVDVKTKKCKAPGCLKQSCFGPISGTFKDAEWCGDHRLPDHVNLKDKKCKAPGCLKKPYFGPVGGAAGDAQWCSDHRLPDHVDLKNIKCKAPGCSKQPTFGPVGGVSGDAQWCGNHRLPDHVNLKDKKCKALGCLKRPSFGPVDGKTSDALWCSDHRLPDHVNLTKNRCLQDGCISSAWYAAPGHKPSHCAAHADKTTMIAFPRKRCCVADCNTFGPGLYEHLDQRYCEAHAPLELARCLVTTTCKTCLMENVVTTNGTCDGCAPERVRRIRHLKEEQVAFALQRGGVRIAARDVILEGKACGLERPDFQVASVPVEGTHWVYVECDEWQHASEAEECRVTRMRNLAEVRGVPVVFIRFNPDSYLPGENPDGDAELRPLPLAKRYDVLVRWVKHAAEHGPPAGHVVSVLYLFFDGFTNRVTAADWKCLVARE